MFWYLGQIMPVAFGFAPPGWALCEGQVLPIAQYRQLYNLLGNRFGGDGVTTFGLPDLRGRVVVGASGAPGATGGAETVTLVTDNLPPHQHAITASGAVAASGRGRLPSAGNILGVTKDNTITIYTVPEKKTALAPGNILPTGGGQPHSNMQPFLALNYIIALEGEEPNA